MLIDLAFMVRHDVFDLAEHAISKTSTPPPLFCQSPLNLQTAQALPLPLFQEIPAIYWFLMTPPP